MVRSRFVLPLASLVVSVSAAFAQPPAMADSTKAAAAVRALRHASPEWQLVAAHLPDPATATPASIEQAGDILRARRFLDDALEYYRFALERGGNRASLDKKLGVTELQLGQPAPARAYFRQSIALNRRDAEAWNNLGAVETMAGRVRQALFDYQRAVLIDSTNSIFHANLGTAYFAIDNYDSARHQFEVAVKLDPEVFERGGFGGSQVRVLSAQDRGRLAFEMARLAAGQGEQESMLHWLAQASEAGLDVRAAMDGIREFQPYRNDARIAVILRNAQASHSEELAAREPVPTLADAPSGPR